MWDTVNDIPRFMDSEKLIDFFSDKVSAASLASAISTEVESFRLARSKKNSSSPIYVGREDIQYSVTKGDIKNLCDSYLDGELNEWHLEYLCNVIELSDAFSVEDDELVDTIFLLSTPEINYPITPALVSDISKKL